MAEPLSDIQEPGFFSQVSVSPSLFLTPGSIQVVGLIGTGKATKTVLSSGVRAAVSSDLLPTPAASITLASSNAIYKYPASSYALAQRGTVDLSTITLGTLTGKVLTATIDGQSAETVTFTSLASVADIAVQTNAAFPNIQAEIDSASHLVLYVGGTGMDGKSMTVNAGNANPILGLTDSARAQSLRWDPAVTDPNYAPQAGTQYQVQYERPKAAADRSPKSFFGLPQVVAEYGDVSASNTLALGAQGAFGNGATLVVCRQLDADQMGTEPNVEGEITAALVEMEGQDVQILVPMYPLNGLADLSSQYLEHVSKMSSLLERKERICILGVDEIDGRLVTTGGTGSWEDIMSTFNDLPETSGLAGERVMVVNPGYASTNYKGNSVTTDGTYIAACLAGRIVNAAYDEAEPMTRKPLTNINALILPEMIRAEKNVLTSYGVTVIETRNNLVQVRRAVTADASSIASVEPSIVRAFDRVSMDLRESLENRFVGTKILPTVTATAIEAATSGFLDQFVASEIIGAYRNVKATQNATEPRQFDIRLEAVPVFPFIWGFLEISIVLS